MEKKLTYKNFADNDYEFFMHNYAAGVVANQMSALAQEICEKYLKYIIDVYFEPQSDAEFAEKTGILHTHNLKKLLNFLSDAGIEISYDVQSVIKQADGYYFSARYPGDDSFFVKKCDIESCVQAVEACKNLADNIEKHNGK